MFQPWLTRCAGLWRTRVSWDAPLKDVNALALPTCTRRGPLWPRFGPQKGQGPMVQVAYVWVGDGRRSKDGTILGMGVCMALQPLQLIIGSPVQGHGRRNAVRKSQPGGLPMGWLGWRGRLQSIVWLSFRCRLKYADLRLATQAFYRGWGRTQQTACQVRHTDPSSFILLRPAITHVQQRCQGSGPVWELLGTGPTVGPDLLHRDVAEQWAKY